MTAFTKGETLNEKKKHYETVHRGFFPCTFEKCPESRITMESLEKHLASHGLKRFKCEVCDYKTNTASILKIHQRSRHKMDTDSGLQTDEFNINCCGKMYNKYGFSHHNYKVHKPRTCPICGKVVKILLAHMNRHKTEADREYKCEVCGKGFNYQPALEEHGLVDHQGVRYSCRYPDCKSNSPEYRDKSNRDAHERKKHGLPYSKFLLLAEGSIKVGL